MGLWPRVVRPTYAPGTCGVHGRRPGQSSAARNESLQITDALKNQCQRGHWPAIHELRDRLARLKQDPTAQSCSGPWRSVTLLLLGAVTVMLLTACDHNGHASMMGQSSRPVEFESNGERIYFTGTSNSGKPITYTGGNMHLDMMGGGCAACHGADRSGGRMMPELWLVAPSLTRSALFESHDGHRGGHPVYDMVTLRRTLSTGFAPNGSELSTVMPRWSMNETDWQDLMAYLSQ